MNSEIPDAFGLGSCVRIARLGVAAKFKDFPEGGYADYPADSVSAGGVDLVVEDADSEAGIALRKTFANPT